jgi:hypothetical protein
MALNSHLGIIQSLSHDISERVAGSDVARYLLCEIQVELVDSILVGTFTKEHFFQFLIARGDIPELVVPLVTSTACSPLSEGSTTRSIGRTLFLVAGVVVLGAVDPGAHGLSAMIGGGGSTRTVRASSGHLEKKRGVRLTKGMPGQRLALKSRTLSTMVGEVRKEKGANDAVWPGRGKERNFRAVCGWLQLWVGRSDLGISGA